MSGCYSDKRVLWRRNIVYRKCPAIVLRYVKVISHIVSVYHVAGQVRRRKLFFAVLPPSAKVIAEFFV